MKELVLIAILGFSISPIFGQTTQCGDSLEFSNLELIVHTDCWPEENTWILQYSSGDTICEGGPYNGLIVEEISEYFWLENGSYSFTFFDAANDGLFGTQWGNQCSVNGTIELIDAGGNVLLEYDGSYNFDSLYVAFEFDELVSIHESPPSSIEFSAYPNPFNEEITLRLQLSSPMNLNADFISTDGRTVASKSLGQITSGSSDIKLSPIELQPGFYLLRLSNGEHQIVKTIVKF